MLNFKLIDALKQIELEKGIAVDTVLEALEDALLSAYKKNYGATEEARVEIDKISGAIQVFELREAEGDATEEVEVTPENFGRIAAQTAKQVIIQRIREAERELMFDEYHGREGDIVTGIIQQNDQRYTLVDLGKVEALLPPSEQVRGERYDHGARLKTYIVDVRRTTKGPQIMVSRTHPGLLKRLFELEVPEIYDGLVEIKAVAREAGQRSKVAVASNDPNVDPVGACVGAKGSRVRMIVSELRGEKVDIVEWKEDPAEFVANAISPAKVKEVVVDPDNVTAEVIVPDNQLSLAIGKEGQNARLAAKLTGWRIDILSESQAMEAAAIRQEQAAAAAAAPEPEQQCRAITGTGKQCRNKAKPGTEFCGVHQKMARLIEEGEVQVEEVIPLAEAAEQAADLAVGVEAAAEAQEEIIEVEAEEVAAVVEEALVDGEQEEAPAAEEEAPAADEAEVAEEAVEEAAAGDEVAVDPEPGGADEPLAEAAADIAAAEDEGTDAPEAEES